MKLSPAEYGLLHTLSLVVGNSMPMEWLKPPQRRMVARMRIKGLLSKRNRGSATATQLGLKAHRQHQ